MKATTLTCMGLILAERTNPLQSARTARLVEWFSQIIDTQVDRADILERLRERIVRFAASRLMRDDAEDLAQEVLVVLHEKYPTLDRVEDLLPLSLEIARFKIMGARRKIMRRGEHTQVSVDDLPLASGGAD